MSNTLKSNTASNSCSANMTILEIQKKSEEGSSRFQTNYKNDFFNGTEE